MGLGDRRKCREIAGQEEMQTKALLGGGLQEALGLTSLHQRRNHQGFPQPPPEERFSSEAQRF
jgi:hypothetical protein